MCQVLILLCQLNLGLMLLKLSIRGSYSMSWLPGTRTENVILKESLTCCYSNLERKCPGTIQQNYLELIGTFRAKSLRKTREILYISLLRIKFQAVNAKFW